jgi:CRP-like cAMP-binding protein
VQLNAGETLFSEGEEPHGVYVLQSGQVDLLFTSRSGDVKPLRIARAGQILGLSCVVTQRVHDCTATAATDCRVGFIDTKTFQKVLVDCPGVWFSVLRLLSSDVNAVYDDIRTLAAR